MRCSYRRQPLCKGTLRCDDDSSTLTRRQDDVRSKIANVSQRWAALLSASNDKKSKLAATSQLVEFQHTCDELESWMGDRLALASNQDVGDDIEETLILLKRFEEAEKDLDQGLRLDIRTN